MSISFCLKSRTVKRLLSVVMICTMLPNGFAWGALQPPLSQITNPVFGTPGGTVPSTVPPNLTPYVKDVTAAIRLGKALFWDMQVGSDGVTACASCHYRAGADPVVGTFPKDIAKRDKNQLHPGPDTIFGNNSTVINTFITVDQIDPVTGLIVPVDVPVNKRATGFPLDVNFPDGASRFALNYLLQPLLDFPLFMLDPPTSRLVIDPLTGFTGDVVTSLRDTNDVVGSQGVRLADFQAIAGLADDAIVQPLPSEPRQVTGRNTPSVINAVFNYTNFWDGRANNIFNGSSPFGPLDPDAGIWVDNGTELVKQKIAIPNSSLASQAVGPALSDVEMSFKGRTFPEVGRKMLSRIPLATQLVHPQDSVLGLLSNDPAPGITVPGPGNNTYKTMIEAAFVDTLWNSGKTVTLDTNQVQGPLQFDQYEANFSLFWGLAIQLYEATLVSDRTPFDRFQAGNQNVFAVINPLSDPDPKVGFATFDSKCTICHSGSEFSSAVVGSNNCSPATLVIDCNRVAFTNNSTHTLIKQDVNVDIGAPPPGLIDAGFFNIGVRPTSDDPGRGGSASFIDPVTHNPVTFPLSFTKLAEQAAQSGLPFVTPKPPLLLLAKVKGSFKTPGLRNVELTAPYFHNGDALTLDQVVEFYTRGGNFPGNPELAAAMQPIGNLRNDALRRADIVAFLKKLTDERVRNETAPFDHPELMIPNGVDAGNDAMITLDATGGADTPVPIDTLTINPLISPTNLTSLLVNGTVDDSATVAVDVTNTTTGVSLPTAVAAVGGVVGGVPTDWSINLTGLTPGLNRITVTATSITGGTKAVTADIQITPTAIIKGTPPGGSTKENFATLTIEGGGVVSYQYSLDGVPFSSGALISSPIILTGLTDGTHSVAVIGMAVGNNQQLPASATTTFWTVKANPPVLTLNATGSPTGNSTLTISGTVELGSRPSVSVDTSATIGPVITVPVSGISTWSCDISGLAGGTTTVTVIAKDIVFNTTTVTGVITRVLRDGSFKGSGIADIADALKALRIAVDLEQATVTDMIHGDVAPLVNGITTQNDRIDVADALLILRKSVGLVTF